MKNIMYLFSEEIKKSRWLILFTLSINALLTFGSMIINMFKFNKVYSNITSIKGIDIPDNIMYSAVIGKNTVFVLSIVLIICAVSAIGMWIYENMTKGNSIYKYFTFPIRREGFYISKVISVFTLFIFNILAYVLFIGLSGYIISAINGNIYFISPIRAIIESDIMTNDISYNIMIPYSIKNLVSFDFIALLSISSVLSCLGISMKYYIDQKSSIKIIHIIISILIVFFIWYFFIFSQNMIYMLILGIALMIISFVLSKYMLENIEL